MSQAGCAASRTPAISQSVTHLGQPNAANFTFRLTWKSFVHKFNKHSVKTSVGRGQGRSYRAYEINIKQATALEHMGLAQRTTSLGSMRG